MTSVYSVSRVAAELAASSSAGAFVFSPVAVVVIVRAGPKITSFGPQLGTLGTHLVVVPTRHEIVPGRQVEAPDHDHADDQRNYERPTSSREPHYG